MLSTTFQATYRVLVLKNAEATRPYQRVHAVALELNLVGRGSTVHAALGDLAATVFESCKDEFEELLPSPRPDPDPDLAAAYADTSRENADGALVLRRLLLHLKVGLTQKRAAGNGRRTAMKLAPKTVFEDSCA